MRWDEVTAIFGGAFDPPHLGHSEAITGLFKIPGVKQVRIIPTGTPALKTAQTPAEHRLAMAKLAFTHFAENLNSRVMIDDQEMHGDPKNPSYTFHTLQNLRKEGTPLAFVLGVDQVESLDKWYRFPELLGLCHWIALEREPDGANRMKMAIQRLVGLGALNATGNDRMCETRPTSGPKTLFLSVPTPARAISSTGIRREFALNGGKSSPIEINLTPEVRAYLNANHLYGT